MCSGDKSTLYARKVRSMGGGRAVIAPRKDSAHLGQTHGSGQAHGQPTHAAATGDYLDASKWADLSAAELIEIAATLRPSGIAAQCIQYQGDDLCWAQPLSPTELATLYQPPRQEFVAGLGFDNKAMWRELAAGNTEVLQWIEQGYSEFVATTVPVINRCNNPNTGGDNAEFVTQSVRDLLRVGAVADVTNSVSDPDVVRVIAPLTVAVQASGKRRLCWNGRPVNAFMPDRSFKMEHAEKAARMMRRGDYMFTIDMKSGYHQIPCKPWFRKFLCFRWMDDQGVDRVYQWQVCPFGLSTAPRAYSKLSRCLLRRWRSQGIRCSNYIDDFIFFAPSPAEALRVRSLVLRDLQDLGWFISPDKCKLQPGTMVEYLGLVFCSLPEPHVRIPEQKVTKARNLFSGVLKRAAVAGEAGVRDGKVRCKGHTLTVALGFLQSLRLAVSVVPIFTRELYSCLNQLPRVDEGWFEYGSLVALTTGALAECRFWQQCIQYWNGFVLPPVAVSRVVYTDGSGDGFGALIHRVLHRKVEPACMVLAGSWEHHVSTDSVYTELEGLWRTVLGAGSDLAGQVVLHRTDSISTYCVVCKGGSSKSARLTAVVRRLQVYCMLHNITLASQYVGSGVIINSGADLLSRTADVSDGAKLNPVLFQKLWQVWGPFVADMFASAATVQQDPAGVRLPYWAMLADGHAAGVDGLSADWAALQGTLYAFPPVKLVGEALLLAVEQGVKAVFVVPEWPTQWWWPVLLQHALVGPIALSKLHVAEVEGPMFVQGRKDLPAHPLGPGWKCPETVQWVAVLIGVR